MAAWSKPRQFRGTTISFDSAKPSMKLSSRCRKMGMRGLATAPMRAQAR